MKGMCCEKLIFIRGNHTVALTTDRRAYLWGCGAEYCINPASCDDSPFPTVLVTGSFSIALE